MSQDRAALIADCDHPQLEYVGDPDPLTDLKCVKCPWQHSIDFIDPYTLPYLHEPATRS